MNKKTIILSSIFIISLIFLISFSTNTFDSITTTTNLYITKVFPSLFLFVLFTDILLTSNVIYYVSDTFSFLANFFKLPKDASIPIILGLFCGFPSSAKAINKLYIENKINITEAHYLMAFTNNASPIFIISTIRNNYAFIKANWNYIIYNTYFI